MQTNLQIIIVWESSQINSIHKIIINIKFRLTRRSESSHQIQYFRYCQFLRKLHIFKSIYSSSNDNQPIWFHAINKETSKVIDKFSLQPFSISAVWTMNNVTRFCESMAKFQLKLEIQNIKEMQLKSVFSRIFVCFYNSVRSWNYSFSLLMQQCLWLLTVNRNMHSIRMNVRFLFENT